MRSTLLLASVISLAFLAAGCGNGGGESAAAAISAAQLRTNFESQVAASNYYGAIAVAGTLVKRYPGTPEAVFAGGQIAGLRSKAEELAEARRIGDGKATKIDLALTTERGSDGLVRIIGTTNLPDGMELGLDLRSKVGKYFAQDSVKVSQGRISSAWFSDDGAPLATGAFTILVHSPLPDFEPEAVRKIIGDKGQNLHGATSSWRGITMVSFPVRVTL